MRKLLLVIALAGAGVLMLSGRDEASAGGPCIAPKSWGEFRGAVLGGSQLLFVFEDQNGTIRTAATVGLCQQKAHATEFFRTE